MRYNVINYNVVVDSKRYAKLQSINQNGRGRAGGATKYKTFKRFRQAAKA